MQIQSAFSSAVQGYQRAEQGVREASAEIARQPVVEQEKRAELATPQAATSRDAEPARPVTEDLVKLRMEERNAQANARTLRTADQMVGTLINTTA